jgi:hypothetical protein
LSAYIEGKIRTVEGKTVEEWIGRKVHISALRGDEPGRIGRFTCTLEGVDAYGVVVEYEKDEQRLIRFFPWHSVFYVHLAEGKSANDPPRRAGFAS